MFLLILFATVLAKDGKILNRVSIFINSRRQPDCYVQFDAYNQWRILGGCSRCLDTPFYFLYYYNLY